MKHSFFSLILIVIFSETSFAQESVKELDQKFRREIKGRLARVQVGKRPTGISIYYFKSDQRLYSIQQFEKSDSSSTRETFQFAYINDTLLRVYYFKLEPRLKKHVIAVKYMVQGTTVALNIKGDLSIPDNATFIEKSLKYRDVGNEILVSKR